MKEPKKMSFEKGKNYIVDTVLEVKELFRPVLVSVHGYPNSGKTELTMGVINQLYHNHKCLGFSCQCRDNLKDYIRRDPVFLLMEDLPGKYRSISQLMEYFERGPNLSVFITRFPMKSLSVFELRKIYRENYDGIIENPMGREKNNKNVFALK